MPLPVEFTFYPLNAQVVELDGIVDNLTLAFLNGLPNVVCSLQNSKGKLDPVFQTIACAYVVGSNGVYRGNVPGTFNAPLGSGYRLIIDGTNGAAPFHLEVPSVVKTRVS